MTLLLSGAELGNFSKPWGLQRTHESKQSIETTPTRVIAVSAMEQDPRPRIQNFEC
jgi:hypothetical protein